MIIKAKTTKKYLEMFSDNFEFIEKDNYLFAITTNEFDDFRQFSYVNGLNITNGGTHIDVIVNEIVTRLKEKLQKKYKTIKPGDIKNKIRVVAILRDFPNLQFESQTKEKVTNSVSDVKNYYGDIDWEKLALKIYKNKNIIEPITEIYRIKEEYKKRQDLKDLTKNKKRVKSEKYLAATKTKKYLVIGEGKSAVSGLQPVLGREQFGYFELKGKPLNAYDSDQAKFTQNKELSELYKIINSENYQNILIATDADSDGSNIIALLIGFFQKYLPNIIENRKLMRFKTPLIVFKKNKKIVKWYYDFDVPDHKGYELKYYKGLGTWKENDLKEIVKNEKFENMVQIFEPDEKFIETLNSWLLGSNTDIRKEMIKNNDFELIKI